MADVQPEDACADRIDPQPVRSSELAVQGPIWSVMNQSVDLGAAGVVRRQFIRHPGAVGVIALNEHDEILLLQQYRHPVGAYLWEPPAGLLDQVGEDPWLAAARELREEADLRAASWHTLIDWFTSPGGSSEAIRIYLARELSEVPDGERHQRTAEEWGMPQRWVPLDQAHSWVLSGALHNPTTVVGVLAAVASRAQQWETLRPMDTPWPEHPQLRLAR